MVQEVTIEGLSTTELRRSIEDKVRNQCAEEALAHLRAVLAPYCTPEGPLPADFADHGPDAISLVGWNLLADCIWKLDQCGEPVSAIAFELEADRIGPEDGEPALATRFFFDTAWPFSECSYDELLDGFNDLGAAWHNDHADAEEQVVGVDGLAVLSEALLTLRESLAAKVTPSENARALVIGTLFVAILFHIAVRDKALRSGLPRAMAVLSVTHSDQAVLSSPVLAAQTGGNAPITRPLPALHVAPDGAAPQEDPTLEAALYAANPAEIAVPPAPEHASPTANEPASSFDPAVFLPSEEAAADVQAWHLPPPGIHTTGSQLRRRLVTEESIAELARANQGSFLSRLFRRR